MNGKWSDPQNLTRALNMIDEIKELERRGLSTDQILEYLPESEVEWLKEFFSGFMVDLQQFITALAKIATDFLNTVVENLSGILENVARAQKDGRTRAFGSPAVAFQAPPIFPALVGDPIVPLPDLNVQGLHTPYRTIAEQAQARVNIQLDQMAQQKHDGVARRRRFE